MAWQNIALIAGGGMAASLTIVHGALMKRYIAGPIDHLLANEASMTSNRRRVVWAIVPPLLHVSTLAWFSGGLAVICAAIWLGREARIALSAFIAIQLLFGAWLNLHATRGRHPGGIIMAVASILIVVGLIGLLVSPVDAVSPG